MERKKLTVNEALEAGYTHVIMEGDDSICKIEAWDFEHMRFRTPLLLEPTKRTHFTITAATIAGLIESHVEDQDQVFDAEGALYDAINEKKIPFFGQLADALNAEWAKIDFIPATDIELIPNL